MEPPRKRLRTSSLSRLPPPQLSSKASAVAPSVSSIIAASHATPATITVIEDIAQSMAVVKSQLRVSGVSAESSKDLNARIEKIIGSSAEAFWSLYRVNYSISAKEQSSVAVAGHSVQAPVVAAAASSSSSLSSPSSSVALRPASFSVGRCTVSVVAVNPQALPSLREKKRSSNADGGNGNGNGSVDVDGTDDGWKLQTEISAIIYEAQWQSLIGGSSMSLKDVARVTHCAMNGASLWLGVNPIEDRLRLTNNEFVCGMRYWAGLQISSRTVYCKCGSPLFAGHAMRCNHVHGPATTERHDTVASELSELSQELCHIKPQMKPRIKIGPNDGMKRELELDLLIVGVDGFRLGIDVTFIYGESDSYLPNEFDDGSVPVGQSESVKQLMKLFAQRQSLKAKDYESECKSRDIEFVPFILESHGYMHETADRVLERMAEYSVKMFGGNFGEIIGYMKRRIAIAIQRGNARLNDTAIAKSMHSFGSRVARGLVVPPRSE